MFESRRRFLATVGAAIAVAGCQDGGADGSTPTPTEESTPGDESTPGTDATVAVRDQGELGDILVDGDGMTLYMFDSDTQGAAESTCSGGCLDLWPALTVEGEPAPGDGVDAALTTFERADGSTQVAADGWPLYTFANDTAPGDANGQGANDVWWVLRPDGTPVRADGGTATPGPATEVAVRSHDEYGDILVDGNGMSLYMFDSDARGAGESTCGAGCTNAWPPLTGGAPDAGDGVEAELTTFEREDGDTQIAANGWPLYYYSSDGEPGDTVGQGVSNVWWVLDAAGKPIRGGQETDSGY